MALTLATPAHSELFIGKSRFIGCVQEVLRHHELEAVLTTVVRYFGGIKLGAGGLMWAYTDAIAQGRRQRVREQAVPEPSRC